MLKSQDTVSEQPTLSTGQIRVTPEELTKALAAIETRKQAVASHLAGTIPLQDAVTELHLDSTPEEIWAEVQAQRVKAAPPETAAPIEAKAEKQEPVITPLRIQLSPRKRRWVRPFIALLAIWALDATGVIPHFPQHTTSAPIMRSLAQISDGKEVYADDTALVQVSEGKPLTQIIVSENGGDNRWRLVKISGHLYLRGYIVQTNSLSLIQGKALHVFNKDDLGELHKEPTSNITLRVDKVPVEKSGGDDSYSELTVPNFQPDPLTTLSPWH